MKISHLPSVTHAVDEEGHSALHASKGSSLHVRICPASLTPTLLVTNCAIAMLSVYYKPKYLEIKTSLQIAKVSLRSYSKRDVKKVCSVKMHWMVRFSMYMIAEAAGSLEAAGAAAPSIVAVG